MYKHSLIFKTEEVGTITVDRVSSDRKLFLICSRKIFGYFFLFGKDQIIFFPYESIYKTRNFSSAWHDDLPLKHYTQIDKIYSAEPSSSNSKNGGNVYIAWWGGGGGVCRIQPNYF